MSILKNCLSLQTTKLSYKCRTSYYSTNSLCLHIPFVLSLPALSRVEGSKHIRANERTETRPAYRSC